MKLKRNAGLSKPRIPGFRKLHPGYLLNHRPRKTLNYKTPHAVFFAEAEQEAA